MLRGIFKEETPLESAPVSSRLDRLVLRLGSVPAGCKGDGAGRGASGFGGGGNAGGRGGGGGGGGGVGCPKHISLHPVFV